MLYAAERYPALDQRTTNSRLRFLEFRILALTSEKRPSQLSRAVQPLFQQHGNVTRIDLEATAEVTEMLEAMDSVTSQTRSSERIAVAGAWLTGFARIDEFAEASKELIEDWYRPEDYDLAHTQDVVIAHFKDRMKSGQDISITDFEQLMATLKLDPREAMNEILAQSATPQS